LARLRLPAVVDAFLAGGVLLALDGVVDLAMFLALVTLAVVVVLVAVMSNGEAFLLADFVAREDVRVRVAEGAMFRFLFVCCSLFCWLV